MRLAFEVASAARAYPKNRVTYAVSKVRIGPTPIPRSDSGMSSQDAYRETLDPSGEWFEKCARHSASQTSRLLQHIYLCDPCARRFVHEVFNDRPFVYHGETVQGFCGLCNKRGAVTLRQHFACGPCWNVVLSYQKTYVASEAVREAWKTHVQGEFPALVLEETEEVTLDPYVRGARTKRQNAATLEILDFLVSEKSLGSPSTTLFHIEMKSGPGNIDTMSEFQLDVNDYEDILGASCNTGAPAYVFHVQVEQEYHPPTRRGIGRRVWWTDLCRLRDAVKRVAARRGEDKKAIYFRTSAFAPVETFPDELRARGFELLRSRIDPIALAIEI